MRRLTQSRVLVSATGAALFTAIACYPRLAYWKQPLPVASLEVALFLSAIILWAFVFAWHTHYTKRPVFTLHLEGKWLIAATAIGLATAAGFHWLVDPTLRTVTPESYPAGLGQLIAMALFSASMTQLLLVFAPFAWLMRLSKNQSISAALTMLFGVIVLLMKAQSGAVPAPAAFLATLLVIRIILGICAVMLYLQGGVLLVWWCGFLIEARHLLSLPASP